MDNPYEIPVDKINNTIKINKCLTLVINIFIAIGSILNILDNDLIRDLINGEYKFQRTTIISGINEFYSFVALIVSNVYYFLQR